MDASFTRSGRSEWNKAKSGRWRGHFTGIRSARRSDETIGSSAFRSRVNSTWKKERKNERFFEQLYTVGGPNPDQRFVFDQRIFQDRRVFADGGLFDRQGPAAGGCRHRMCRRD